MTKKKRTYVQSRNTVRLNLTHLAPREYDGAGARAGALGHEPLQALFLLLSEHLWKLLDQHHPRPPFTTKITPTTATSNSNSTSTTAATAFAATAIDAIVVVAAFAADVTTLAATAAAITPFAAAALGVGPIPSSA